MARRRGLDGGVWARRGARWWWSLDDDDDDDALDLAQLTAGRYRLALWSGAFLYLLLRRRMKRLLRHLRVAEEVGGRVPESSAVAKWEHFAAGWTALAL